MNATPRQMVDMNDLVAREFRRVHGYFAALELPLWWAAQVRAVIGLQDPYSRMGAAARWAQLTRRQQQDRLVAYLERLPGVVAVTSGSALHGR